MLVQKYKLTDQKNMRSCLHKVPQGHNLDQLHTAADLEPAFPTVVAEHSAALVRQCILLRKTA